MKITDFYEKLCDFAPLSLSSDLCEKDDLYDNSGMIIEPSEGEELKGVAFMLDLTHEGVMRAIKEGCNFIVTHHPAIYSKINRIESGSAVAFCVKNGVAVASMHLNFDCAKRGIDFWFASGLGGDNQLIDEDLGEFCGYGRLFIREETTAEDLVKEYKKVFNTDRVNYYGDKDKKIKKVVSFCGAGLDERALSVAKDFGADLVASADIKHHLLVAALESGISVLACTHYAAENYGMKKIAEHFAKEFNKEKIIFFDDERLS